MSTCYVPHNHFDSPTLVFFFFNATATTEIYTLSLHDALPISKRTLTAVPSRPGEVQTRRVFICVPNMFDGSGVKVRSEEHTSELQSQFHLVCRLLLEKKKNIETSTSTVSSITHIRNSYHFTDY